MVILESSLHDISDTDAKPIGSPCGIPLSDIYAATEAVTTTPWCRCGICGDRARYYIDDWQRPITVDALEGVYNMRVDTRRDDDPQ